MGNIVNRVFESSGPEGKVRGTPQQIIEKYLLLARDAQLSNDRVAAENFLQHAEHYTRMLGEAQREMAAEQESRRQQFGGPQGNDRPADRGERGPERGPDGQQRERHNRIRDDRGDDQPDMQTAAQAEAQAGGLMLALGFADDDDAGLVDLPEARTASAPAGAEPDQPAEETPAPEAQPRRGRGSRGPRRPRNEASGPGEGGETPQSDPAAAE